MNHLTDIQIACTDPLPVSEDELCSWIAKTLDEHQQSAEITLRLVDKTEITFLNKTYRKMDKPTNVLAFPGHIPEAVQLEYPFLGDVVLCPAVLKDEACEQNTALNAHWAHIVIHGVLHLLGYDHINDKDTALMQAMEIKLLANLGFANPYQNEGYDIE